MTRAPRTFAADDAKLKNMILFFAKESQGDPKFGATKLNKQLFYSDFLSFGRTGKPISGHPYFRLPMGPAPKQLVSVRAAMMQIDESCTIQHVQMPGNRKPQQRVVALRDPDMTVFSAGELAMMQEVLRMLWREDGTSVSNMTHELAAWRTYGNEEIIPFESIFVGNRELTAREIEFAKKLAG